MIKSHN